MRLFPMDYSFEYVLILTILSTDPFLVRVECQAKRHYYSIVPSRCQLLQEYSGVLPVVLDLRVE